MKKLIFPLLALFAWPLGGAAMAAPTIHSAPVSQVLAQGQIVDAKTGLALDQVYIRQQDSLNTTFSNPSGLFKLTMDGNFPAVLVFSKDNYEPVALPLGQLHPGQPIQLQPIQVYRSDLPKAHSTPTAAKQGAYPTQLSLFYQGHHGSYGYQGNDISGWALNELGINMNLALFKPWMIRGQLFRSRVPFNIEGFPYQPVFFNNNLQIKLGGGYSWEWQPNVDVQVGADFLFMNRTPDNKNNQDRKPVPYTGSTFDLEHNRFALGANASLAWQINDRLLLLPEISLYPLVLGTVRDEINNPTHLMFAGELGTRLYVKIIPGISAVAHYQKQLWWGSAALDHLDYFGVGLSVDPWGMTWMAAPKP